MCMDRFVNGIGMRIWLLVGPCNCPADCQRALRKSLVEMGVPLNTERSKGALHEAFAGVCAGRIQARHGWRLRKHFVWICRSSDVGRELVMVPAHIQLETSTLRKVLKRLHYPLDVMLVCVRWYAAYPLSLRNLEEMMAERGVIVDHATVHRWALKILPLRSA